jgi:hypothetical protein
VCHRPLGHGLPQGILGHDDLSNPSCPTDTDLYVEIASKTINRLYK